MPSLAARASEVEARDELEQHVMWETPLALWREEESCCTVRVVSLINYQHTVWSHLQSKVHHISDILAPKGLLSTEMYEAEVTLKSSSFLIFYTIIDLNKNKYILLF